ncbi:hypothetical protein [Bradyrhizobium sp. CCBAU 11357]|uniref:hypothetical protein n=1 Tax=Bradyrhizobium sp. CCBAU 11357 TaxID=1630808 RepID=UPI0023032C75|nr:hypothetical protein [Bradyrhizobium sp. CCBAU 11357]
MRASAAKRVIAAQIAAIRIAMQQICAARLRSPDLAPCRDAVSAALEQRHVGVRKLWREILESIGIDAAGAE